MTPTPTALTSVRIPTQPEELGNNALLGICTSIKPAPGKLGQSATRSLLSYTLNTVGLVSRNVFFLDLRNNPIPLFDGRMPDERDEPSLKFTLSCVNQASALLLSVPAYWSGVSGVFKNFIDTLCGPIYDMEGTAKTVFTNKPVGLLIVGADEASARAGTEQAQEIVLSTGASLVAQPVTVSNPRLSGIKSEVLSRELIVLGGELAQQAYLRKRGET